LKKPKPMKMHMNQNMNTIYRMIPMLVKLYGIIDIGCALIIFFWTDLPDLFKWAILLIMLFKGIPSLMG
jgi:hypothetical protein